MQPGVLALVIIPLAHKPGGRNKGGNIRDDNSREGDNHNIHVLAIFELNQTLTL